MPTLSDKVRLAQRAERQFGLLSRAQLQELGISAGTISGWLTDGYLHRVLPHVYAVGHRVQTVEGELAAALLYAGPGAALSHATAAWWLGLLEKRPHTIQVTTPHKCPSRRGIRAYARRPRPRVFHRRIPTTTIPQTLLDVAATESLRTTRKVLANAEYKKLLDLEAVKTILTRGSRGAATLRKALETHQPRLAFTESHLEVLLFEICEAEGIPVPETNVYIEGWKVDALWRGAGLAVELDGYGNHHTPAQLKRDRRKEMALRAHGLTPVRYSGEQLEEQRQAVAAELRQRTSA